MLGERLNGDVGNKEYAKKRSHYVKTSELEITQQLGKEYKQWDEESIKRRAVGFADLILEIWKFDNPSRV